MQQSISEFERRKKKLDPFKGCPECAEEGLPGLLTLVGLPGSLRRRGLEAYRLDGNRQWICLHCGFRAGTKKQYPRYKTRAISDEKVLELADRYYNSKLTLEDLAAEVHVTAGTLGLALRRLGLKAKKQRGDRTGHYTRHIDPDDLQKLQFLYWNKDYQYSFKMLAEWYNKKYPNALMTESIIRNIFKREDIPSRTIRDATKAAHQKGRRPIPTWGIRSSSAQSQGKQKTS